MSNRKVINATTVTVDGIEMKSKIERTIYLALKNMGITPLYEGETFTYPGLMKSEVLKSIEYYTEDLPEEIEEKVSDKETREEFLAAASQKVEALQVYLDLIEG